MSIGEMKDRWRRFRAWQQQPYQVAPLSAEQHQCATCGTSFQGNYCPRCGQSARIGRYSFKKALLLFLDVWGLGNRGMFRTLRDLVLRPGYMIRDYLKGMQMAYFPPFKLFFLLTTLSLVIDSGVNVRGVNRIKDVEVVNQDFHAHEGSTREERSKAIFDSYMSKMNRFSLKFPNITSLSMLIIMSGFLYVFFRKSPRIPDLRYSEFLVALIYSSCMVSVYDVVLSFFCAPYFLRLAIFLMPVVPLKQMSGFGLWRILFYMLLMLMAFFLLFVVFVMAIVAKAGMQA